MNLLKQLFNINFDDIFVTKANSISRGATVDFYQARPPERRSHHRCAAAAMSILQNPGKTQVLAVLPPVAALISMSESRSTRLSCHNRGLQSKYLPK